MPHKNKDKGLQYKGTTLDKGQFEEMGNLNPPGLEVPFQASNLENIDRAVFEWLDEEINVFMSTNKGWKKSPVVWISAERAFQIKKEKDVRDKAGALVLPVITIERTSVAKDISRKGTAWANIPMTGIQGTALPITKRIVQDKTANFKNAQSARKFGVGRVGNKQINFPGSGGKEKVVYETLSIPMPVYITMTYSILLKAEYQQQMNEMMAPFITKTGGINYVPLRRNGHFYEGFITGDFAVENNISTLEQEERKYETKIEIKVNGYIYGAENNSDTPIGTYAVKENAVEIKMPREKVIYGDEAPWRGKYLGLGGVVRQVPTSTRPVNIGGGGFGGAIAAADVITGISIADNGDGTKTISLSRNTGADLSATFTDITGSTTDDYVTGISISGDATKTITLTRQTGADLTTTFSGPDIITDNTVYSETPTGAVNGTNTIFSSSADMTAASVQLWANGVLMLSGASSDYTINAANQVTFADAPETGDHILLTYVKG